MDFIEATVGLRSSSGHFIRPSRRMLQFTDFRRWPQTRKEGNAERRGSGELRQKLEYSQAGIMLTVYNVHRVANRSEFLRFFAFPEVTVGDTKAQN